MADNVQEISHSYISSMIVCCLSAVGCFLSSFMLHPVIPLYSSSLGISTARIGMINSAFFFATGFLSLPIGMLSDRLGHKLLISAGALILSVSSLLLYFSGSFIRLTGSYLLYGVGMAAFGTVMMAYVAVISPSTHLGRSYGWYTLAMQCAMSVGPAVGGFICQRFDFRSAFLVSAVLTFLAFLLVSCFPSGKPRIQNQDASKPIKTSKIFKELMKNRQIPGYWFVTMGSCFGLGMFVTFMPLHAQNQGLEPSHIGILFLVQGICNALSRVPMGYLGDKTVDRKKLVVIGLSGLAFSLAGFGMSSNMGHFILSSMLLGGCMGMVFTSVGALIAETAPRESLGLAMGGYNSSVFLGMMISSAVMGSVIQVIGFGNGFYIAALTNLVFIVLFYAMIAKNKRGLSR